MADGKNQARALRILEIINDFRTLQDNTLRLLNAPTSTAPDVESQNAVGYAILRQCRTDAQTLLAENYNTESLRALSGPVPDTEAQKASLRRIIFDASSRRFRAHKIYLRVAAGVRWTAARTQTLQGQKPNGRHAQALRAADQHLAQEIRDATDQYIFTDLRNRDIQKNYWVAEDPTLEQTLAYINAQSRR